ncbi:hypothetical protein PtA15_1A770 [Puccinia triticina]|uniref:Uncharacterized protein n=1 Tax=Puccinia triticina TaxID=208348 RepID=A0ABY7C9R7_9BASI|nr:uncharacterized protein PtA15_1A770 [Puccinia triticina]WAQ81429.1 hypothetical protein PtA15_1A770 [Puccinia triticina]
MTFNRFTRLVLLAFVFQGTQALGFESQTARLAPRGLRFQRRGHDDQAPKTLKLKSDDVARSENQTSTIPAQDVAKNPTEIKLDTGNVTNDGSPATILGQDPQNTTKAGVTILAEIASGGEAPGTIHLESRLQNQTDNASQTAGVQLGQKAPTTEASPNATQATDPKATTAATEQVKVDLVASADVGTLKVDSAPQTPNNVTAELHTGSDAKNATVSLESAQKADAAPKSPPEPTANPGTDPKTRGTELGQKPPTTEAPATAPKETKPATAATENVKLDLVTSTSADAGTVKLATTTSADAETAKVDPAPKTATNVTAELQTGNDAKNATEKVDAAQKTQPEPAANPGTDAKLGGVELGQKAPATEAPANAAPAADPKETKPATTDTENLTKVAAELQTGAAPKNATVAPEKAKEEQKEG